MGVRDAPRVCVCDHGPPPTWGRPGGIREGFTEEVSLERAIEDGKELPRQQSGEAGHPGERHSGPLCGVWGCRGVGGAERVGGGPGVVSWVCSSWSPVVKLYSSFSVSNDKSTSWGCGGWGRGWGDIILP